MKNLHNAIRKGIDKKGNSKAKQKQITLWRILKLPKGNYDTYGLLPLTNYEHFSQKYVMTKF